MPVILGFNFSNDMIRQKAPALSTLQINDELLRLDSYP